MPIIRSVQCLLRMARKRAMYAIQSTIVNLTQNNQRWSAEHLDCTKRRNRSYSCLTGCDDSRLSILCRLSEMVAFDSFVHRWRMQTTSFMTASMLVVSALVSASVKIEISWRRSTSCTCSKKLLVRLKFEQVPRLVSVSPRKPLASASCLRPASKNTFISTGWKFLRRCQSPGMEQSFQTPQDRCWQGR